MAARFNVGRNEQVKASGRMSQKMSLPCCDGICGMGVQWITLPVVQVEAVYTLVVRVGWDIPALLLELYNAGEFSLCLSLTLNIAYNCYPKGKGPCHALSITCSLMLPIFVSVFCVKF